MNKRQNKTRRSALTSTLLRAYRFNSGLIIRFEAHCERHLRHPRSVVEALMHHWLAATSKERDSIAAQYQEASRRSSKERAKP